MYTASYDTACASFLTTKFVKALAKAEQENFPKTPSVAYTDLYVADVLSDGETLEKAKELKLQLIQLCNEMI